MVATIEPRLIKVGGQRAGRRKEGSVEQVLREQPGLAVFVVLILAVAACFIVQVIARHWQAARQWDQEAILKEQMILRGMSAREIVEVLGAGQAPLEEVLHPASRPDTRAAHRRPATGHGWLVLALGIPLVLFLVCSGLLIVPTATVVFSSDDALPARILEEVVPPVGPER
jgi:hypothetical protein